MERRGFFLIVAALTVAFGMVACSEEDDTVEEYPDWRVRNETFFNNLTDSVLALLEDDTTRTDWKRIKSWSKSDSTEGSYGDYIIVNVVEESTVGGGSPLYTDTVSIHYTGKLLPSTSYPSGYVFDYSFYGDYDADLASPTEFAIGSSSGSSMIDGFATALQHMQRGDHWIVYIPYQLAYGTSGSSPIPGYSTLIFEIWLVDFWSPDVQEDD